MRLKIGQSASTMTATYMLSRRRASRQLRATFSVPKHFAETRSKSLNAFRTAAALAMPNNINIYRRPLCTKSSSEESLGQLPPSDSCSVTSKPSVELDSGHNLSTQSAGARSQHYYQSPKSEQVISRVSRLPPKTFFRWRHSQESFPPFIHNEF